MGGWGYGMSPTRGLARLHRLYGAVCVGCYALLHAAAAGVYHFTAVA